MDEAWKTRWQRSRGRNAAGPRVLSARACDSVRVRQGAFSTGCPRARSPDKHSGGGQAVGNAGPGRRETALGARGPACHVRWEHRPFQLGRRVGVDVDERPEVGENIAPSNSAGAPVVAATAPMPSEGTSPVSIRQARRRLRRRYGCRRKGTSPVSIPAERSPRRSTETIAPFKGRCCVSHPSTTAPPVCLGTGAVDEAWKTRRRMLQ